MLMYIIIQRTNNLQIFPTILNIKCICMCLVHYSKFIIYIAYLTHGTDLFVEIYVFLCYSIIMTSMLYVINTLFQQRYSSKILVMITSGNNSQHYLVINIYNFIVLLHFHHCESI